MTYGCINHFFKRLPRRIATLIDQLDVLGKDFQDTANRIVEYNAAAKTVAKANPVSWYSLTKKSVSYTHLDVYKRQISNSSTL